MTTLLYTRRKKEAPPTFDERTESLFTMVHDITSHSHFPFIWVAPSTIFLFRLSRPVLLRLLSSSMRSFKLKGLYNFRPCPALVLVFPILSTRTRRYRKPYTPSTHITPPHKYQHGLMDRE
ncbi:hypothetical protein F4825DRAFT_422942 [Nemania diffusa]|nr:hypothetical protein F4825DRAFT_422942 [Nemania diffusa]